MTYLTLLDPDKPEFPDPDNASTDPGGLLAIGGNLAPDTLLLAYRQGIFPWFCDDEPIMWWSPDPRAVIFPGQFYISSSLARLYRQQRFTLSINRAFDQVIAECGTAPRKEGGGTWITAGMQQAYNRLHGLGHAHSVEVWDDSSLVGGLYGVAVGAVFCGESMFSKASNGSKLALLHLLNSMPQLQLIDCQLPNPHLQSLGAQAIPRIRFLSLLEKNSDHCLNWPG